MNAFMLSCFRHVWLYVTLWTVACPISLSKEFSRQEYWSGWPHPSQGDLHNPWFEPYSLMTPALVGGFFTTRATWENLLCVSVQSLSHVQLFATPWHIACQASLSITNSRSSPRLMSIESVTPSSHLMLCRPLLLLPSIFSSIRVFSNESALHIRLPKY